MTIDISNSINDDNTHLSLKPSCPKCNETNNVCINKVIMNDDIQTIEFFCGPCGIEFGPFKCDVWAFYRPVPQLAFNIRILGLVDKK